jgi:hypothetical protein
MEAAAFCFFVLRLAILRRRWSALFHRDLDGFDERRFFVFGRWPLVRVIFLYEIRRAHLQRHYNRLQIPARHEDDHHKRVVKHEIRAKWPIMGYVQEVAIYEHTIFQRNREMSLDIIDAMNVSEQQSQIVEEFEATSAWHKHKDATGVPTGLGEDLERQIKISIKHRKAKPSKPTIDIYSKPAKIETYLWSKNRGPPHICGKQLGAIGMNRHKKFFEFLSAEFALGAAS